MGFEHARRGYDCLVTTWKRTRIKNFCWTMDKRVVAVTVVRNVLLKRKRRAAERLERVREERRRRRRAFLRRQAMERLMFVALMTLSYCNLSPERTIWTKERSSHWWEHVVKSTFTQQDWLQNFRMSQCTFMYLCHELRSSIEKSDTDMRRAVPTDMRVAITLGFLATGADYRTNAR